MSNNSAAAPTATRRSDRAGRPAPHAGINFEAKYQRLMHIIEKEFEYEFSGTIADLADTMGHLTEHRGLCDDHKDNLVWTQAKLIRFIAAISEEVKH